MKQPLYICSGQFEALEERIAPATFFVTNLNDTGEGSLREAIADASFDSEINTIKFQKGLEGTITLLSVIEIEDSVKIVGPGADKVSISGNDKVGIFHITDTKPGTIQTVTISGLSFVHGAGGAGGAIATEETLILDKTAFIDNYSFSIGGAIYSRTAGDFILKNSIVSGNTAPGKGGGICFYSLGGDAQIINSEITDNAAVDGGGIYIYGKAHGANFLLSKSKVTKNTASGAGGGILTDFIYGTLTIKSSSITENSSVDGAGLSFDKGTLVVEKSTFFKNGAENSGGAISAKSAAAVTIKSSKIIGNTASNDGGGLFLEGAASGTKLIALAIADNEAGDSGGGIFAAGEKLEIKSSTFGTNFATNSGGGIRAEGGGVLNLTKVVMSFNRSGSAGGGVSTEGMAADAVELNVVSSTFAGNKSMRGGGIDILGDGGMAVSGSKFLKNEAQSGDGGAMHLRTSGTAMIAKSSFQENSASDDAGAVALDGWESSGVGVIFKSKFVGNSAGDTGGAIKVFQGLTSAVISGSTITKNEAGSIGGGIYTFSNATVEKSKIDDNLAPFAPNSYVA